MSFFFNLCFLRNKEFFLNMILQKHGYQDIPDTNCVHNVHKGAIIENVHILIIQIVKQVLFFKSHVFKK